MYSNIKVDIYTEISDSCSITRKYIYCVRDVPISQNTGNGRNQLRINLFRRVNIVARVCPI